MPFAPDARDLIRRKSNRPWVVETTALPVEKMVFRTGIPSESNGGEREKNYQSEGIENMKVVSPEVMIRQVRK